MRTVFKSTCVGITCKSIKRYNWKLFNKDSFDPDAGWMQIEDLDDVLLTELDSPSLSIKGPINNWEDALFEDTEYKYVYPIFLRIQKAFDL